jgi:hypothetical protein
MIKIDKVEDGCMSRGQIFIFDVIIATTAFFLLALVITSISREPVPPGREATYAVCLSGLEALKANGTLSSVAVNSASESLLNYSLKQLPGRFGYKLDLSTYNLNGSLLASYSGQSGNLTDAVSGGNIVSVQSSFISNGSSPVFGKAALRCWVEYG